MIRSDSRPIQDCILTNYPLSRDFRGKLSTLVDPRVLEVSAQELAKRPFIQVLQYLRSLKVERLLLPVEDENGSALLPVMKLLASLVPARQVFLVKGDFRLQAITRAQMMASAFHLIHASAATQAAVIRAKAETSHLLSQARVSVAPIAHPHVLYLNANLWFGVKAGGSVGHISGVVNALLEAGYPIDFVSAGGRLLVSDSARYVQLRAPAHFGFPWELNHYRFHFDVVQQLSELTRRERFGFIYQRMSIANYSGVMLSRQLSIPLVLEYNGSEAWVARNWGRPLREQALAERIEEVNIKHAHLIVTISDVLREELLSRGVAPERIVTYPNCIDPTMFDPRRVSRDEVMALRRRHGILDDAIVVTFIGTFGQWHGAEVLARAIRQLLDLQGAWVEARKLHFLFVGDGLMMPDVRQALGEHANGPHVTLAGLVPQHEAPRYLAASDILSSPHVPNVDGSRFFGSPTKLFEYMAMGKAILASDLDQIGDVLADSRHVNALPAPDEAPDATSPALLCNPGNPDAIVAGLQFLVDRPDWRQTLGMNARHLALAKYTWPHHVQAILQGIQRLGLASKSQVG